MTDATLVYIVIGGGSAIAVAYGAIIKIQMFVSKHIAEKKKHPCSDDIVYEDVCDERGNANEKAHEYLTEKIEGAIARSDEHHQDLKSDMTEIKTLIRNNHH